MISFLQVENLSKRFGEQLLFENITFEIGKNQKVALIAKNGMGKSTLLRIIAGKDSADTGSVIFRNDISIGILDQDPELNPENYVFEEVFNKPKLSLLLNGIESETELTTEEIAAAVTGEKPSVAMCYEQISNKLHSVVDRVTERRKITNKSIGIDAEPSPGLYGTLYFDLLAEEDTKSGVYIIDQPEDQISQVAIKEHVLDAFKRMSANRQVLMITHNPLFVVNLDVDNVIVLARNENGTIDVKSGALEYECDDYKVLDLVAKTVEGGADVVRKRLKRYGSEGI